MRKLLLLAALVLPSHAFAQSGGEVLSAIRWTVDGVEHIDLTYRVVDAAGNARTTGPTLLSQQDTRVWDQGGQSKRSYLLRLYRTSLEAVEKDVARPLGPREWINPVTAIDHITFADIFQAPTTRFPSPPPGTSRPRLISKVLPEYNMAARRRGIEGRVIVRLVVLEDGTVGDVVVVHGLGNGLDEASIQAVKRWKFEPGMYEGKPIGVTVQVEVDFVLK